VTYFKVLSVEVQRKVMQLDLNLIVNMFITNFCLMLYVLVIRVGVSFQCCILIYSAVEHCMCMRL
jgi:hypothetical protein